MRSKFVFTAIEINHTKRNEKKKTKTKKNRKKRGDRELWEPNLIELIFMVSEKKSKN